MSTILIAKTQKSEILLSQQAWKRSENVMQAIVKHPFNQELMSGTLEKTRFSYYIAQDKSYLENYAKCLSIIASKIEQPYAPIFLKYAQQTYHVEQTKVHQYFQKMLPPTASDEISPANVMYTSYLLQTCALQPVEVAVAAILPCFWIYQEVGKTLAKQEAENNPYHRWIETYSSESFDKDVTVMIGIFDTLSKNTTPEIRQKMLDAFYMSTVMEWYFWDDAYYHRVLDKFNE